MSTVRDNLMTRPGYSPYCGAGSCQFHWPRTRFDGRQFVCNCGWKSEFPDDFIAGYRVVRAALAAAKGAGE